ncbi:hypothetical protein [Litoribrevibacter albus]|uniref:hypothetical protein n=1 Tax=Litoribrevibacter albus TaxID=1473156 RepID=UPI0024E12071|nr:hypothetical protein [Litoribrevibacter albus]
MTMISFELQSKLDESADTLSKALLTMGGVNNELGPYIRMSAPARWSSMSLADWPTNEVLFTSWITLFGVLPIDLHRFKFEETNEQGFKETSSSLMNRAWHHSRLITELDEGCLVTDTVQYQSKLGPVGRLFLPVYKAIFKHRHRRLISRYGQLCAVK